MLSQNIARASRRGLRRIHTAARSNLGRTGITVGAAATLALGATAYASVAPANDVYGDAEPLKKPVEVARLTEPTKVTRIDDDDVLRTLGWGTNRSNVLSPDKPESADLNTPTHLPFLDGVALRDLALHGHHGACVDARGDVYQWGLGFFGKGSPNGLDPTRTLQGKNIAKLQVTESRVFALSSTGQVYVLSAKKDQDSSTSRSGWLWGSGGNSTFVELETAQKLSWGEKIVDISAGRDHLLALTSSGRAFAHPVSLKANTHGQLGFRKVDVPDPSSKERIRGELTPLAIADPYANASRFVRRPSASTQDLQPVSESLKGIDDTNIAWSNRLFEIPALRGVKVRGIAAGARSSYVCTDHGSVLSWGANEHGQLGLRSTVSGDTVTVPTEVVLGRDTTCTSITAGGNLAFFATERRDGTGIATAELFAVGDGRYGGLGTAVFTSAQTTPARARAVSGLLEYSEAQGNLQPIAPRGLSVASDGHVLCALDTRARAGPGGGGMDLLAWGNNYEHQLGNGRRASVAVPESVLVQPGGARCMLHAMRANEVRGLDGRVAARRVWVEQVALAGPGTSVVYWKIA